MLLVHADFRGSPVPGMSQAELSSTARTGHERGKAYGGGVRFSL